MLMENSGKGNSVLIYANLHVILAYKVQFWTKQNVNLMHCPASPCFWSLSFILISHPM